MYREVLDQTTDDVGVFDGEVSGLVVTVYRVTVEGVEPPKVVYVSLLSDTCSGATLKIRSAEDF